MCRGNIPEVCDGLRTLPKVWVGSRDSTGGSGQIGEPLVGPGRVGGPTERSGTGWGTVREVQDGYRGPPGGKGQVGVQSRRTWTGDETLSEVRDGSGNSPVGPASIGGPLERSGMGQGTLP